MCGEAISLDAGAEVHRQASSHTNVEGNEILAIGAAGKMGKAVAAYFACDPGMQALGLLDAQVGTLEPLAKADKAGRIRLHPIDIQDTDELLRVMKQYDVAVVALPNRKLSYKVMEAAIEARARIWSTYWRSTTAGRIPIRRRALCCLPIAAASPNTGNNCTRRRSATTC